MQRRNWYPTRLVDHGKPLCMLALMSFAISACTMSDTQQRVGSGAAIGAAGGAIAGGLIGGSNSAALGGAAIGAVAGAGTGYVVDQRKKRQESDSEVQRLREENRRLREQQQQ